MSGLFQYCNDKDRNGGCSEGAAAFFRAAFFKYVFGGQECVRHDIIVKA